MSKPHDRRTLAVAAGAGLLAWLLLHGSGWRFGRGKGADRRVRLRVTDLGVTADNESVTIEEAVARARAAGSADVVATGAARTGTVADLLTALHAAGVQTYAPTDVWNALGAGHA